MYESFMFRKYRLSISFTGLVYLLMKHFVDRYNMYFAYGPTKVEKEVHGTAINYVIVCMFLLQINLLAYVNVHLESQSDDKGAIQPQMKGLKVFSVIGFCITAALFMGQVFFNMCANFSPILYKVNNFLIIPPTKEKR